MHLLEALEVTHSAHAELAGRVVVADHAGARVHLGRGGVGGRVRMEAVRRGGMVF